MGFGLPTRAPGELITRRKAVDVLIMMMMSCVVLCVFVSLLMFLFVFCFVLLYTPFLEKTVERCLPFVAFLFCLSLFTLAYYYVSKGCRCERHNCF